MAQIFQGIRNVTNGTLKTFEGTTKALEGTTSLTSLGFEAASKIFNTAGRILGGSSPKKNRKQTLLRRSKRLEGKDKLYYSPKRRSPRKKLLK